MPFSVFDIAGPIMVGPSSSHTAGACKIGQFARALFNKTPEKVTFVLHGSFGSVYKGHATDKALLAGIMKFKTSDPRLKEAFEMAKQKGIKYEFIIQDLGENFHPNTVKITLEAAGKKPMSVIGSSIGGGNVTIVKIDDFDVQIHSMAGRYKTLVCQHEPHRATLEAIKKAITEKDISIASLESSTVNGAVLSVFNLEGRTLTLEEVMEMSRIPGVAFIRSLHKLN